MGTIGTIVILENNTAKRFFVAKPLQQLAVGEETRAQRVRETYGMTSPIVEAPTEATEYLKNYYSLSFKEKKQ